MLNQEEKQYRYPGTRPFQENDRELFFGRHADIEKLSELIVLEKLVLLFSKSGYGKSSLLNAGVIPRLKEVEKFQTLNIRLNDPERNPVELLSFHLKAKVGNNDFLESKFNIPAELKGDDSALLWYHAKSLQLAQKDGPALVLFFDQFEELFNYSPAEVEDFGREIASLLNPNLPEKVRKLYRQKMESSRDYFTKAETRLLLAPLNLKIVLSLRSDRISLLNQLKGSIPAVFKKTYELQPLNKNQALEALLEPAGKEGDFASPKFIYSKDSIALILNSLLDKEHQHIETFQLQLICQHVEELIIKKQKTNFNANLEVTAVELGKPEAIFEQHYNTIISSLPEGNQLHAKILIEDKLIIGGNRVPLPKSVIITEHQIPEFLLKILVDKRLLRSEPNTVGGISYELSHDTLVAPIQKTAQIRREKEAEIKAEKERVEKREIQKRLNKTRVLLGIATIALLLAIGAIFYAYNQYNKAEKQAKTSQALLLNSTAKDLLAKGMNTEALRVGEFAYTTALDASPNPPATFLSLIADAFYFDKSFQLMKVHTEIPLSLSPDGDFILTVSKNEVDGDAAILFDLKSRKIQTFVGNTTRITSTAFSPDGKLILTGNSDNTTTLWDINGDKLHTFKEDKDNGDKNLIQLVSFSPDGHSILTYGERQSTILWNTKGDILHEFSKKLYEIDNIEFSPDGNSILTVTGDNKVILWDTKGNILQNFEKTSRGQAIFSPDGKLILTVDSDKKATLWDIKGNKLQTFGGHTDRINSVAFSPNGKFVLTGDSDGVLILWDINGRKLNTFEHTSGIIDVAFSPDGSIIHALGLSSTIIFWDIDGKILFAHGDHQLEYKIFSCEFLPDGNSFLILAENGNVILWDANSIKTNQYENNIGSSYSISFSPDGKSFLVGGSGKAILWDTNGSQLHSFKLEKHLFLSVKFSPNGNSILTGSTDKTAVLWDTQGNKKQTFRGHTDRINSVAFSPDGRSIFTGSEDSTAILWDIQGNKIRTFEGHSESIESVAFSPDGNAILTGGGKTALLWDIDGDILQSYEPGNGRVAVVAFSPDGNSILTAGWNIATLWDTNGNKLHSFEANSNFEDVVFSPDGKSILTGNERAILWDINGEILHSFEGFQWNGVQVAYSPDGKSILLQIGLSTYLCKTPSAIYEWLQNPDSPIRQLTPEEKELYGITEVEKYY